MRNYKYYFLSLFMMGVGISSCVDDTAPEDEFGKGPNLVSFSTASANFAAVSNGDAYEKSINLKVKGPSTGNLNAPITATLSVDPASTAIEGVHYQMESKTLTLSPNNNYLAVFPIVMLTEGIDAPLPANPTLILNVASVSGENNVIGDGKKITIFLNYLCYEEMAGNYLVTIDHTRCNNAPYAANYPYAVTITANPDGSWHLSSADGGFLNKCTGNSTLVNPGDIVVVCGEVQPSDNLDYGSLGIGNILSGQWDEETGTLTLNHSQTFTANWPAAFTSTYVRQ